MGVRTSHDLRCFCSRHPKLAEYGVTQDGEPYLHVRVFKQARMFGEVIVTSGDVDVCCRECFRWTKVRISRQLSKVDITPEVETPRVLSRLG